MRYKMLRVSSFFLVELFKKETTIKVLNNALPKDTTFIRIYNDVGNGWGDIFIVVESSEFNDLNEGDVIPELPYPILSN